ncbi:Intraflagellar transport protein 43 [Trinorchestia longiramus]|nr:Intraflagellar transport protein 43 [Trinorchestia longiramus]
MNFIRQITNRDDLSNFEFSLSSRKNSPMKGRRATGSATLDTMEDEIFVSSQRNELTTAPPGGRKAGGWANTSVSGGGFGPPEEDARFSQIDNSDDEIPAIPDLEEVSEQDLTQQVAQAPSVAVNRVATFKELDSDLLRHAAFSTLDDIDLRMLTEVLANEADVREVSLCMLTEVLANEADVREPDIEWKWDSLFAEVSSELLHEWDDGDDKSTDETHEHLPFNL